MTDNKNCSICENILIHSNGDAAECPRCGKYEITYEARVNLRNVNLTDREFVNASGWILEHQNIKIDTNLAEALSSIKAPSVAERAEKVLIQINQKNHSISDRLKIDPNSQFWLGISYSASPNEFIYLVETYLSQSVNFLSLNKYHDNILFDIQITPRGYEYLESLKVHNKDSQIGFCAMWFDGSVKPIWTDAIEPAIKNAGYDPKRIDGHHHNNRIDDEIIAMLRRSKFVVADFTGQRGGVYFEAGFALGLGLQVIWTCKNTELKDVHFDNRQYNFVLWEDDKLDEFKAALQNRIEATIGRGNFS